MSKYYVDLEYDQVEKVVQQVLMEQFSYVVDDLSRYDHVTVENAREIEEMLNTADALKTVLAYFGVHGNG